VSAEPRSRLVLVTGGSSGLGAAVCAQMLAAGSTVMSIDRRPSERVPTAVADLADTAAAERATRDVIDRIGGLDAVVCCAGVDVPGRLGDVPRDSWETVVTVNLLATAAVIRAALPDLLERSGRVVTVASTLGHRAVSDATAYCASKFGIVGFTRALAAECRGRVGVTLLTPGGMQTAFFDDRDARYRPPADAVLADPDDIARAVLFVLSQPVNVEVRELAIMSPVEESWP
jgi:NADP-dependent 3-hydroxy acid dehydrogenase YdfG